MGENVEKDYDKMVAEGIKDRDDMVVRMALAAIYRSFQEHNEFWAGWITLRSGPMAEAMGMFADSEIAAAKSLKEGIKAMGAAFEIMEVPKR